jgi:hypothetical protein
MATSNPPAQSDDAKTGTVQTATAVEKFHTYMLYRARENSSDRGSDVMASQGERILGAETEEDIWNADAGGTIQAKDIPDVEVEIRSFEPVISNRQDIENSRGYYLSMDATCLGGPSETLARNGLTPGQDFVLQTGAELLMYKIRSFEAGGYLPIKAVIKSYTTQSGNTVLKFLQLPKRVTAGHTA